MPTINQLIRKPRKKAIKKSKAPALGSIVNTLKTRKYDQAAPGEPGGEPLCHHMGRVPGAGRGEGKKHPFGDKGVEGVRRMGGDAVPAV